MIIADISGLALPHPFLSARARPGTSTINIFFNLALSYYYLQCLKNCSLCHTVIDRFWIRIIYFN